MIQDAFDLVMGRIREDLELESESGLALALGMKPAAYFNRKKAGSIPYENVIRLAKERRLDLEWILGGIAALPPSDESGLAGERRREYADMDRFSEFELVERKGVLGSAGPGAENVIVEPKGALAFRRDWLQAKSVSPKELIVADVVGDSMERVLFNGDTVVFREQLEITADDIYLFCLDGRLFVKRLSYRPAGGIEILAENRDRYPPFELTEKEAIAQRFEVRGRFFWRGGDRLQ